MVTVLDCISRIPSLCEKAIAEREDTFRALFAAMEGRKEPVDEIVFIGSGTSNTASVTARPFAQKVSGVRVTVAIPDEFHYGVTYFNPNALYVFVSQTGTSIETQACARMARERGALTAALSQDGETPLCGLTDVFVNMGCGYEEFGTRTIGYTTTVLTEMLLALELGYRRGTLSQAEYEDYLAQAGQLAGGIQAVTGDAMKWMDVARWQLFHSDMIVFTGIGALFGVSLEGAMKVWEMPMIPSMGYELDEGIHGPNFGYSPRQCVVVLDTGELGSEKAQALARYMKNELKNGLVIGPCPIDETDLKVTPRSGAFGHLEYAAAVQVLAYRLAREWGRYEQPSHVVDHHVMNGYFVSHTPKEKE